MARMLCWSTRSMPAMPIAESSAPMVVGIRQTSNRHEDGDRHVAAGVDGERLERAGGSVPRRSPDGGARLLQRGRVRRAGGRRWRPGVSAQSHSHQRDGDRGDESRHAECLPARSAVRGRKDDESVHDAPGCITVRTQCRLQIEDVERRQEDDDHCLTDHPT